MLGRGEVEFPKLKRLFQDSNSWAIIESCFSKVWVAVPNECLTLVDTQQKIINNLTESLSKASRISVFGITGGKNIGTNRCESLNYLIHKLGAESETYVMMLDPDDYLINPPLWKDVFASLRQRAKPPVLIEFNYVTDEYSRVSFDNLENSKENYLELNPWDINTYDDISGYKYYNPHVRVSGIQKLFSLAEIDPSLFTKYERYEDGIPFADMLSKTLKVGLVPFAAIAYDRSSSGILTEESLTDEVLDKLVNDLTFKNFHNSYHGSHVPFEALRRQITSWKSRKSS